MHSHKFVFIIIKIQIKSTVLKLLKSIGPLELLKIETKR